MGGAVALLCAHAMVCLAACSPGCFLKPKAAYDPGTLAAPPDYSRPEAWAALPSKATNAHLVPGGQPAAAREKEVDVFYVHPTSWMSREVFNDPLTDPKSTEIVDQIVLANQASVFHALGDVYAPRYRQSSISVFYAERAQARESFGVAYGDIERAFDVFLSRCSLTTPWG